MTGYHQVLGKRKRREATADFQRGPTDVKTLLASSIWKMSEQDRNLVLAQMHDWAIKYKGRQLFVKSHDKLSSHGWPALGWNLFIKANGADVCLNGDSASSFLK
jgi:hypothetical protein